MLNPQLSDLRAAVLSQARTTTRGPCPGAEEIAMAVTGALRASAQRNIAEHCGRCPSCFEDWSIAKTLHEELDSDAVLLARPPKHHLSSEPSSESMVSPMPEGDAKPKGQAKLRRRNWTRNAGWCALAAAACAALLLIPRKEQRPVLGDGMQLRSGGLDSDQSLSAMARQGQCLTWAPLPAAHTYELLFYDAQLREVARRGEILEAQLHMDAELAALLFELPKFYWVVRATDGQGHEVVSAPLLEVLEDEGN